MYDLDAPPKSLLTETRRGASSNPKTAKSKKDGYLTAILHLAPHKLSGRNVCASASPGCIAACLNKAGRGGINLDADGLNIIQVARIRRTRYFTRDREAFMRDLAIEIADHVARAIRLGMKPAVRLNGTSDLPWENIRLGLFPNIMTMFPDVQFYDYTKVASRLRVRRAIQWPGNYHLTFSLSEENDEKAADALALGVNVAVAMNVAKNHPLPARFSIAGISAPVIDGDITDLRFLDPRVSIVGLRAKGKNGKADTSGFVRNV